MEAYVGGSLRIDVERVGGDVLRLCWRGKGTARDPSVTLLPFFEAVAGSARRAGARVEMSLENLEYFNTPTLTAILRAIRLFQRIGTHLRITHLASGWQSRACEALQMLGVESAVAMRRG